MANCTKLYELVPENRKSFYGKAIVREYEDGTSVLFSYHKKIMTINYETGEMIRHYGNKEYEPSSTTLRHIKAFCGFNKTEFMNLRFEEAE